MKAIIYPLILLAAICPGCSKRAAKSSEAINEHHNAATTSAIKNEHVNQDSFPSNEATCGDLVIKSESCLLGIVKLKDILGNIGFSQEDCLTIVLSIRNNNATKKHEYYSWAGKQFSRKLDHAILTDNFGNKYKLLSFSLGNKPLGAVDEYEAIYPEKTLIDRLIFEKPLDNATYLDLNLPADNIGGKGLIKLRIHLKSKEAALKDKQDELKREIEEKAAQADKKRNEEAEVAKRTESAKLDAMRKDEARAARIEKERQENAEKDRLKIEQKEKEAADRAAEEQKRKSEKLEAERKVAEDKANELLKAAKRWLAEGTTSGKDIAISRLKDLLKRFPDSEAAKEGRKMLDSITKKS